MIFHNAMRFFARQYKILTGIAFLFFLMYPFIFSTPLLLRLGTLCMVFVMLALALNIVTGFMGQTSFGTAAFWGIGCYTAAILSTRFEVGSGITFIAAMLISGLFSLLLSIPVMKLEGYYLSIVTLGFCEIIRLVELNWVDLTRGPMGIPNIPKLSFFGMEVTNSTIMYFIMLALLILTTYFVSMLSNSHFGRVLTAIRDDGLATRSIGINITGYKIAAFFIYAMISGLAGAFYAHYVSYIDPSMFTFNQSVEITVMVILGGLGNIVGSFIGAIVLTVLPELIRGLMEYRMLIYGGLMVALMLLKPTGILGNVNFRYIRQRLSIEQQQPSARHNKRGAKK